MTKNRSGHPRFYELLKEIEDLHSRKGNNYASDENPLANFYIGEKYGIDPIDAAFARIGDKISRRRQLRAGKKDLVDESLIDTLKDLAILSLLEIILIENSS